MRTADKYHKTNNGCLFYDAIPVPELSTVG
jgi:hypothetical protein